MAFGIHLLSTQRMYVCLFKCSMDHDNVFDDLLTGRSVMFHIKRFKYRTFIQPVPPASIAHMALEANYMCGIMKYNTKCLLTHDNKVDLNT